MATEEENRRLAYSIVRAQLIDLRGRDAYKILPAVWSFAKEDSDTPLSDVTDQIHSVTFHVEELTALLQTELNRQQREDVGL